MFADLGLSDVINKSAVTNEKEKPEVKKGESEQLGRAPTTTDSIPQAVAGTAQAGAATI